MYAFECQSYTEKGEREPFLLLVHSSNSCSSPGWAKLKPGGRIFNHISHIADNETSILTISHYFLRHISRYLHGK